MLAKVLGVDKKLVLLDLLHVTNKSRFFYISVKSPEDEVVSRSV